MRVSLLLLLTALPARGASVECIEVQPPLELWVGIDSPEPGSELRSFEPDCPDALVRAAVSARGPSPRFHFYLLIDRSGSTELPSGGDIDGDGLTAPADPQGDSVLDAEIAAARLLIDGLDLGRSRLAILRFAQNLPFSTQVEQELTEDAALLHAALDRITVAGPNHATDLGVALRTMIGEHDRGADASRQQVAFLLSDGKPTAPTLPFDRTNGDEDCNGGRDVCFPLEQADRAAARGLVIHSFALGASADLSVLSEISGRTGGRVVEVDVPADIREELPGHSSVGIREALVENLRTGEGLSVRPAPDGSFALPLSLGAGLNDILVTAYPEDLNSEGLSCATDVTRTCIAWSCPDDIAVECNGDLGAGVAFAASASDPAVRITNDSPFDETLPLADADASGRYDLGLTLVRFSFEDPVAGSRDCSTLIEVVDTQPPWLEGVGADLVLECPEPPPPAAVEARDDCDPAPELLVSEDRIDGPCPGTYSLQRSYRATDAAGLQASAEQRIEVVDTTPPLVVASTERLACLWPPNHRFVRIEADELTPEVLEGCSEPVSWWLDGCVSDEPENDIGDGNTEPDCLVTADGALLVRAERQGGGDGRDYAIRIVAEDACGNRSEATTIGFVHVPHDRRGDPANCRRPN